MAAALLRLLPRRRAATLAPLIPASMPSYSKPPYPLRAVTAAGGLPDVRCAQLCASPVPSLNHLFASKGSPLPAPRQLADHQATCRLHKASSATTTVHPGRHRMLPSLLLVPSQIRHFSSTGQETLIGPLVEDMKKEFEILCEALETCNKARDLLMSEGWDDKTVAMFENGLERAIKFLDVYEKGVDDLLEAFLNSDASKDTLQEFQMLHKEAIDIVKVRRQEFNNVLDCLVTLKKRKEVDASIFLLATSAFGSGGREPLIGPLLEDLEKEIKILSEALETCNKACDLLRSEGWDGKTVAMFENGLEKAIKSLDVCEKVMDDLLEASHSSNAPKDTLQEF